MVLLNSIFFLFFFSWIEGKPKLEKLKEKAHGRPQQWETVSLSFLYFGLVGRMTQKKKSLYAPGQYSTNALTIGKTAPYKKMLSLQEKHTAIQIEKICKIIDSTNDFNRLKITYAFHSLFQSSLVCTCICSGMFRIKLGMSHRSGRGNFHKDSGN